MDLPPSQAVGLIGVLVQLGACVLTTVLLFGLRRQRHRPYLVWWSWAWAALSLAVAVVSLRYNVLPQVVPAVGLGGERVGLSLYLIYFVYQTAKFLFLWFLVLGTISLLTNAVVTRRAVAVAGAGAVALGAISVAVTGELNSLVLIQSALFGPVCCALGWWVARAPRRPSDFGSALLSLALGVIGVLWLLYLPAFGGIALPPINAVRTGLAFLAGYNSYFDTVSLVLLGNAMVLAVADDAHRDAHTRHDAQVREAQAARERLAEVLRATHEGILTLRPGRTIDLMNPAAEAMFDVSQAQARGRPLHEFVSDADTLGVWAAGNGGPDPRPPRRCEVSGRRHSGGSFPLELSVSPLDDDAGQGYVVVVRDLTESFRERDAAAAMQDQLARAARLETMGRMVSGVAHELNNPLTAIMAFAQDLAMQPRSDEDREALTVITQQADRCRIIVGDLLIFARSRREERRRISPDELARRVVRVLERDAQRRGVVLHVSSGPGNPMIEVDAAGIEQVLTNLLSNAIQASPNGGRIALAVARVGDDVVFRVDDEGPGIAADVLPRLFEPFFTTKAPGLGTGLGLSVSHAIVEQHGGRLTAENRPDRPGARFTVRLPIATDRESTELPTANATTAPDPMPPGRALVVDDEAAIRVALRRALERAGWHVDEAGTGDEAWQHLERSAVEYAVIVTDLRMPGMSGIELVDRVRRTDPALAERIIVITGDTASPQVVQFLAELATPVVEKPFDIRTVVAKAEAIRRAHAGRVG